MRSSDTAAADDLGTDGVGRWPVHRGLLLVSACFLLVQVTQTDYGQGRPGAAAFWFLLGCLLLWLVDQKRSRAARGLLVVTALVGAVVLGLAAFDDSRAALLAATYLGQALPLLTVPVRQHVQKGR